MYTGTLIQDLMATVERVERNVRPREVSEVMELQRLYELQVPSIMNPTMASMGGQPAYAGAA